MNSNFCYVAEYFVAICFKDSSFNSSSIKLLRSHLTVTSRRLDIAIFIESCVYTPLSMNRSSQISTPRGYYMREHLGEDSQRARCLIVKKSPSESFLSHSPHHPPGSPRKASLRPVFATFVIRSLPPGRSGKNGLFSSPKTPNKCIPRELFFLYSGTHQSPCARAGPSMFDGGFLEAFSRQAFHANGTNCVSRRTVVPLMIDKYIGARGKSATLK